jgi:hypothetical protein
MTYKIKGWKIKKIKVKRSPYAEKGIEWKAEKDGKILTQPTLESLKYDLKHFHK